ncbi:divalent-cation tolerance protein CutA [Lentisphaera profundi]|uniref:Divalent-cation tolerance protein CutA n=1 Tax=Lentisphaera profundi TaxID=1658616 RepID=A0ABY7VV53_9BACT|nr:divalent-cation tolerance protein CutA [Lentisphaera profundi]WDE98103.1 divalent-cation tolerance protein CutA [Lentisphaera profundi]
MQLFYTPCSNKEEAKKIASSLLSEKLIACANVIPGINSLYIWEGELQDVEEVILLLKCKQESANDVESRISQLHSYDCPCILQFTPDKVNPAFSKWLNDN